MTRQIPHASLDLIVDMSLAEYLGNPRPITKPKADAGQGTSLSSLGTSVRQTDAASRFHQYGGKRTEMSDER